MPAQQVYLVNSAGKVKGFPEESPASLDIGPGPPHFLALSPGHHLKNLTFIKNKFKFALSYSGLPPMGQVNPGIGGTLMKTNEKGQTVKFRQAVGRRAATRFFLKGVLALLLLSSPALGQPGAADHAAPSFTSPAYLGPGGTPLTSSCDAFQPPPEFFREAATQLATSGWGRVSRRCPLPPVSVFGLQNHLRLYREVWPAPGLTGSEDEWPEFIAEADDALE
jgi:hypothetical protein